MQFDAGQVEGYLERLGYRGPRAPTLAVLRELHRVHLAQVPFENLSIQLGEPIRLERDALFDKLVARRRGGFCYELNGAFAALLRALGYTVRLLAARVYGPDGALGIPFDHLALCVELDEPWLADVGFGDGFVEPLRLAEPGDQAESGRSFRIARDGELFTLLERTADREARPRYRGELRPYELDDFRAACRHHESSPASPFVQRSICSRLRASGRVTLSGRRLIFSTSYGTRVELPLPDAAAVRDNLRLHFGVELARDLPK